MSEVPVFLSEKEADMFKQFMKYHEQISELIKAEVFELRGGSAVLDFGADGYLMDIKVTTIPYRRRNRNYDR